MSTPSLESAIHVLRDLKSTGSFVPGDCESDPRVPPQWLDKAKLVRAKELFKRHLFGLYFSHLSGLTTLVHVKSILEPLVATKQSASVALLFRRYLGTLTHVQVWYDGHVWNEEDPGFKSVQNVRRMHKSVAARLNADSLLSETSGPLKLSQYDMLITQFAFIGFVILMPEKFGIRWSGNDLECVVHFWRLIGYLLGIEDKYNLCSRPVAEVQDMCAVILQQEMKTAFTEGCGKRGSTSSQMSRGILESIRPYVPLIRWDAYLKYLATLLDSEEKAMKLNMKGNLIYNSMSMTLQILVRNALIGHTMNYLLRRAIRKAHRKRTKIAQRLEKKYADYIL